MRKLLALVLLMSIVMFSVLAAGEDTVVEAIDSVLASADGTTEENAGPGEAIVAEGGEIIGAAAVDESIEDGVVVAGKSEDSMKGFIVEVREKLPDIGRPHVALVLSGGGAKGIAHIPIIEALERYGIPIDKVYGTSMGALIGGLYCAGLSPKEMTEIVKGTNLMNLFTVLDTTGYNEVLDAFDFNSNNIVSITLGQGVGGVSGLIDDYQVLNFLQSCIGNVPEKTNFDTDLVVPFECNATDMLTGAEVIFRDGSLLTAMRASMSLPIIFEPVTPEEGVVLMDGGIVSNYIVHRAVMEGYDLIIVVTLNGYGKNKRTPESYSSMSGVAGNTLGIVLNNVSKGEIELSDYWFSPDTTEFNTLSFKSVDGILEKGYQEVEEQKAKFEEIASLFTEEQKQYKDPNRVGEYYTKFPAKELSEYYSSSESRHEDLLGRTRISFGLYGSGGYGFYFGKDSEYEHTRRVLFPTFSARAFIKDLSGSPFSLDFRLKMELNRSNDITAMVLYRITEDVGERFYGMGRIRGAIGSLGSLSDRNEEASFKILEGRVAADVGAMVTNEYNHSVKAYLTLDNIWYAPMIFSDKKTYDFIPSFSLEAVFYPSYKNGFFSMQGGRADFLGSIGYNINQKELFYKIGLAGENTFKVSDIFSFWIDFVAFSSKGRTILRSTFETYGGWDGMPGYSSDILIADFITGGVGVQWNLEKGFASSFISAVVRGGVRSNVGYGWLSNFDPVFESWVPFKDSFTSGLWDLGVSVGYGFHTPIGDTIFGVGFNKNLQMALYLELK